MNSFNNVLANAILAKEFEYCSLEELQTLATQYPFASGIQLLYSQKLLSNNREEAPRQLQKTLLYFNNPLFINHLLNHPDFTNEPATTTGLVPAIVSLKNSLDKKPLTSPSELANDSSNTIVIPIIENPTSPEKLLLSKTVAISHWETEDDEDAISENDDEEMAELPPLPTFKIAAIGTDAAQLSFTPYHTIDYFAAQGIKLGQEQNEANRFDTQLKSFTTWLKQMKRLPGATTQTNITLNEEKNIAQLAVNSLSGDNANTEAMAEVWIKQGEIKKAIEIYKKLSLQFPLKSAYFAAKIDFIKK